MSRNKYPGYCYCYGKWRIKCVKCASGRIVHDTDKEVLRVQNG